MTDLLQFSATAAILDAILKITPFRKSDFLRFLVCYSGHRILQKTVEKPFVAIFGGLNCKLTRLYQDTEHDSTSNLHEHKVKCLDKKLIIEGNQQ